MRCGRRWRGGGRVCGTPWGEVRIKIASMNGTVTNYAPEYEDCRRIAAEHHVPLKTVMQEAAQAYLRSRQKTLTTGDTEVHRVMLRPLT